jgi:hypothetical protein
MNRGRFTAQRRAHVAPKQARHQWLTVLEVAIDVASFAQGRTTVNARAAQRGAPIERLRDFTHLIAVARHAAFPVEGATPGYMAEAFLKVGRAFAEAGNEARRELYAPALEACARALDGLVDEARVASAEGWKRQLGDNF